MVLRLWQQVSGSATEGVLRKKDIWPLACSKAKNVGVFHEILKVNKGCNIPRKTNKCTNTFCILKTHTKTLKSPYMFRSTCLYKICCHAILTKYFNEVFYG
jgi:hypothetical protein